MCGNDLSIVAMPEESLVQELRTQVSENRIKIKNHPNATDPNLLSINHISILSKLNTAKVK